MNSGTWCDLTRDQNDPATWSTVFPHDHPCFDGHFQSQPVLPGVVQLALVLEVCAAMGVGGRDRLRRFANIKFLQPVAPGARCDITIRPGRDANTIDFRIACAGTAVSAGTAEFA